MSVTVLGMWGEGEAYILLLPLFGGGAAGFIACILAFFAKLRKAAVAFAAIAILAEMGIIATLIPENHGGVGRWLSHREVWELAVLGAPLMLGVRRSPDYFAQEETPRFAVMKPGHFGWYGNSKRKTAFCCGGCQASALHNSNGSHSREVVNKPLTRP